jgi:hypothetical protein
MAFSATTEWDVRTTGSDSNGGGFNTASSGTDYSQQDSPQVTYTDLVIGATNTQLTSSANPFTSAYVGNVINIPAGTGFTTGRYQVVSVASGVATMDRSVGTASSTGGSGKLGGAMATVQGLFTALIAVNVQGMTCHLKAGTYSTTTANAITGITFTLIGYQSAHRDYGTKPLITTATNGIHLIDVGGNNVETFDNISFSHTAATRGFGIVATGNSSTLWVKNSVMDGFTYPINGENATWFNFSGGVFVIRTEIKNSTTQGIFNQGNIFVRECTIHNNAGGGIHATGTNTLIEIYGSILAANQYGANFTAGNPSFRVVNCSVVANTSHGIYLSAGSSNGGAVLFENNIVYGNGGLGMDNTNGAFSALQLNSNNAWGSNASGDVSGWTKASSDVALTADPCTSSASGDYSLNSTTGGGAACKAAGFPGVFPGGTTTGNLDIGAVQSAGGGGGGSAPVNYGFVG